MTPDDRDTTPPPPEPATLSGLAGNDNEPFGTVTLPPELSPAAIPAGQAQCAFAAAVEDLVRVVRLVEAVGMSAARALDALASDSEGAP